MGSLAVYLAQHYASPPAPGEEEDDWIVGCFLCLMLLILVIVVIAVVWHVAGKGGLA